MKTTRVLLTVLSVFFCPVIAQADQLDVPYQFTSSGTGIGAIQGFDPALGVLTSVSFAVDVSHSVPHAQWGSCTAGDYGAGAITCWIEHDIRVALTLPLALNTGTDNSWSPDPAQSADLTRSFSWFPSPTFSDATTLNTLYSSSNVLWWSTFMRDEVGGTFWTPDVTVDLVVSYIYTPIDGDNDGVPDIWDAYPTISLGGRTDTDNDGAPDDCDSACIALGMAADTDDDGDGEADVSDNCPLVPNPDQANSDGVTDGGDACDPDDDNDQICDEDVDVSGVCIAGPAGGDNCRKLPNNSQLDSNNDGCGDACIVGGGCTAPACVND